ncbi:MAG: sigma-70 family RNA polymerase sigma factor [Nannocystaceae bacterium]|nr:sigma-70 family RNA polymerase sigma factor [Nannocystaceae bacterium]
MFETLVLRFPDASRWSSAAQKSLQACVSELLKGAAATHRGIKGNPKLFAQRVGQQLAESGAATSDEARLHLRDFDADGVYLAAACAAGEAAAITRFEALNFGNVAGTLRSMGAQPSDIDDITSTLREKLFVAAPGKPASVLECSGRGSLEKMCRVIAARAFLNRQRSARRTRVEADHDLTKVIAPQIDPELAAMKQHHRDVFRVALATAIEKLSSEDRNLLRLSLIHRLSVDEIGGVFQIHRSTAARRLGRLKDAIAQDTRMVLRLQLGVDRKELQSLFRLVQTGLDKSFIRLLEHTADHESM